MPGWPTVGHRRRCAYLPPRWLRHPLEKAGGADSVVMGDIEESLD